jgi:hypothetical protein
LTVAAPGATASTRRDHRDAQQVLDLSVIPDMFAQYATGKIAGIRRSRGPKRDTVDLRGTSPQTVGRRETDLVGQKLAGRDSDQARGSSQNFGRSNPVPDLPW